jgi:hypothetical protein
VAESVARRVAVNGEVAHDLEPAGHGTWAAPLGLAGTTTSGAVRVEVVVRKPTAASAARTRFRLVRGANGAPAATPGPR